MSRTQLFFYANLGSKASYFWRSFRWSRELLAKGPRKRVGNGEEIYVFRDKWLPRESTFKRITPTPPKSNVKVAEFING